MPAGFFDTSMLNAHNHTNEPGDGGELSNLTVAGTITTTGNITAGGDLYGDNVHATVGIVDEVSNADAANEVPRFDQALAIGLLGGTN